MKRELAGGHSWLVGKSPFGLKDSGVHARPLFGPPLHVLVVGLQTGQGWTKVLQNPPGQSASTMHPLPLFPPPTHAPVSQVPLTPPQFASEQHTAPLPVQRPVSLVQTPPPGQALVPVLQTAPPPEPQGAPGVEPPTQRFAMTSPVR